jgi:hypothetical protein
MAAFFLLFVSLAIDFVDDKIIISKRHIVD